MITNEIYPELTMPIWLVTVIRRQDEKKLWECGIAKKTRGEAIAFGWNAVHAVLDSTPFPGDITITAAEMAGEDN